MQRCTSSSVESPVGPGRPVPVRVTSARLSQLDEDMWLRLGSLWPLLPVQAGPAHASGSVLLAMVGPLLVGAAVRASSGVCTFVIRLAVGPRAPEAAAALAGAAAALARGPAASDARPWSRYGLDHDDWPASA